MCKTMLSRWVVSLRIFTQFEDKINLFYVIFLGNSKGVGNVFLFTICEVNPGKDEETGDNFIKFQRFL